MAEFRRLLLLAAPLCEQASRLVPEDPTPWAVRLLLAIGLGEGRAAFDELWEEVHARDPLNREAHNYKFMYLCQKWYGSHDDMFAFTRAAAREAPEGSPLHVLPLMAAVEWAKSELMRDSGLRNIMKLTTFWREDLQLREELDNALTNWFVKAPRKHAMWYHDLNYLANGLVQANRHSDAKAVYEAIGPYMARHPWAWTHLHPQKAFHTERRKALRQ